MNFKELKLKQIEMSGRVRSEMGDIEGLALDIETVGLLHPIVVAEIEGEKGKYKLLAGGRRFTAFKHLKRETIPAHIISCSDTYDQKVIESLENSSRKNLTFAEEVTLKKEINDLYISKYGEPTKGPDNTGWTKKKTAELFGESPTNIKRDLELAEGLKLFPELKTCKNKTQAIKKLKSITRMVDNIRAASDKKITSSTTKFLTSTYHVEDFFTFAKKLNNEEYDLAEVDPPYGIDLNKLRKKDVKTEVYQEIALTDYEGFIEKTLAECYRVLLPHSWILLWGDVRKQEFLWRKLREAGFDTGIEIPIIWAKLQPSTCNAPYRYLSSCYEILLYARKGEANLAQPGKPNCIIQGDVGRGAPGRHPTERPVALLERLLPIFVPKDSKIIVPFLGSGNTCIAAHNCGMYATGAEINKIYYQEYKARVAKMEED